MDARTHGYNILYNPRSTTVYVGLGLGMCLFVCVFFPQSVQRDVNSIREEYQRLNEHVLKELEGMTDSDKATFLRSQLSLINERLGSLDECSAAYLQR